MNSSTEMITPVKVALDRLNKLPFIAQRTPEWHELRKKVFTASEYASCFKLTEDVISPFVNYFKRTDFLANPRKSAGSGSLAALVKKKLGLTAPFEGNSFTRFGNQYEPVAAVIYQQIHGTKLREYGLIPHPEIDHLGASPDGCTLEGILVEIKCPSSRVPDGLVPFEYWCQMQLQLACCDLSYCDFFDARFVEIEDEETWKERASADKAAIGVPRFHRYGFMLQSQDGDFIYAGTEVVTVEDFEEWEKVVLKSQPGAKRIMYYLHDFRLIRVERDRAWFRRRVPEIQAAWDQVCESRQKMTGGWVPPQSGRGKAPRGLELTDEVEDSRGESRRKSRSLVCDECLA
jgi:putative phage-type endonuclease